MSILSGLEGAPDTFALDGAILQISFAEKSSLVLERSAVRSFEIART
jgi:hypothetical protein